MSFRKRGTPLYTHTPFLPRSPYCPSLPCTVLVYISVTDPGLPTLEHPPSQPQAHPLYPTLLSKVRSRPKINRPVLHLPVPHEAQGPVSFSCLSPSPGHSPLDPKGSHFLGTLLSRRLPTIYSPERLSLIPISPSAIIYLAISLPHLAYSRPSYPSIYTHSLCTSSSFPLLPYIITLFFNSILSPHTTSSFY